MGPLLGGGPGPSAAAQLSGSATSNSPFTTSASPRNSNDFSTDQGTQHS